MPPTPDFEEAGGLPLSQTHIWSYKWDIKVVISKVYKGLVSELMCFACDRYGEQHFPFLTALLSPLHAAEQIESSSQPGFG